MRKIEGKPMQNRCEEIVTACRAAKERGMRIVSGTWMEGDDVVCPLGALVLSCRRGKQVLSGVVDGLLDAVESFTAEYLEVGEDWVRGFTALIDNDKRTYPRASVTNADEWKAGQDCAEEFLASFGSIEGR